MKKYTLWIKLTTAAVIFYILTRTDTIDFKHIVALQNHPDVLVMAAVCLFAGIVLSAIRCYLLLRAAQIDIRIITVLRLQLIGSLFSTVLPGAAGGDAVRAAYLFRILPTHRTTGVLALAIDRVFSLFGLVTLTGLLLWANFSDVENHPLLGTYANIVGGVFAFFLLAALALYLLATFLKVPALKAKYLVRLRPYLGQIRTAVLLYRKQWPSLLYCTFLSLIASFVVVLGIVALSRAFAFAPTFYVTALAGALGNISSAIPLTPGGIGIGEAVFAKICRDLSAVAAPYATTYLVFRLMMAIVSLPGFITYMTFDPEKNRAKNVTSDTPA
jgi:glycosyltransferase 2 family protein